MITGWSRWTVGIADSAHEVEVSYAFCRFIELADSVVSTSAQAILIARCGDIQYVANAVEIDDVRSRFYSSHIALASVTNGHLHDTSL